METFSVTERVESTQLHKKAKEDREANDEKPAPDPKAATPPAKKAAAVAPSHTVRTGQEDPASAQNRARSRSPANRTGNAKDDLE